MLDLVSIVLKLSQKLASVSLELLLLTYIQFGVPAVYLLTVKVNFRVMSRKIVL